MRAFTYAVRGVVLECTLEYTPAQTSTDIDPACPAECELLSARIGDVNVYTLLSASDVAVIEAACVEAIGEWE